MLVGKKTWVGYDKSVSIEHLPELKSSVLKSTQGLTSSNHSETTINHANQLYAKDYTVWNDLNFILSSIKT